MPRLMSFAATVEQMRDRTKTVTRRIDRKLFWLNNLEPGTILIACEKTQGIPKGESIQRIGVIEIVDVRREPLAVFAEVLQNLVGRFGHFAPPGNADAVEELKREGFGETKDLAIYNRRPIIEREHPWGWFVELFCDVNGIDRFADGGTDVEDIEITRIEFRHRPDLTTCCGAKRRPGHADFGENIGCTNWYECSECGRTV